MKWQWHGSAGSMNDVGRHCLGNILWGEAQLILNGYAGSSYSTYSWRGMRSEPRLIPTGSPEHRESMWMMLVGSIVVKYSDLASRIFCFTASCLSSMLLSNNDQADSELSKSVSVCSSEIFHIGNWELSAAKDAYNCLIFVHWCWNSGCSIFILIWLNDIWK